MSDEKRPAVPAPARKPYAPPQLVQYGHVKDVVQGTGGKNLDFIGRHSKSCWIAEALYGSDDSRTLVLRAWVSSIYEERRSGWLLASLYRIFGRATANLIARGVLPSWLFRRLFDALLEKALTERAHALLAARH